MERHKNHNYTDVSVHNRRPESHNLQASAANKPVHQPQSQHHLLLQQQQQNLGTHRKLAHPQAEYFDISKNHPSATTLTNVPPAYRGEVKDVAFDLDMRRGAVEKWLRDRYNREHPNDRIKHPRGFKFTDNQRQLLMQNFERDRYPATCEINRLAYELGVTTYQVKNWFHDQRRRIKKLEQVAINDHKRQIGKSRYTKKQIKSLEQLFQRIHPGSNNIRQSAGELESIGQFGEARLRPQPGLARCNYANQTANKSVVPSRGFKFTEEQRLRLKESFADNKYPSLDETENLARQLGVNRFQIKNWFHDQRRKLKREEESTCR